MNFHDRVVAARDTQIVGGEQNVGAREAGRRLEFVTCKLDQEPERILEVDGVDEHSVANAGFGCPRASSRWTACMKTARETLKAI